MKMKSLGVGLLALAVAACSSNSGLSPDAGPSGGAGTNAGGSSGTTGTAGTVGASGAAGSAATAGASGAAGSAATAGASGWTIITFPNGINRNVDVIFMVDDSASMTPQQSQLLAAFPSYVDVLQGLPGGLPNLHLGVVSSSMGAGRNPSIDHCPQGGDQGVFHTKPLGPSCARASLNAGQNFIINVNGQANYTGTLADVFGCIALLGEAGCGFEHQLESVLRALGADGAPPPPQNANFLRPDALLQVVLLTNEDDCSAPPDSDLFDSSSTTVADPLGPLQSYRCNEFGHLCGGKAPPRQPPGEVDLSGTCVSAEDGRLIRVQDITTALKHLKADPSKVFVAALAAPPNPYKVNVGPSQIKGDPSLWPYVEHSCTLSDASTGDITYGDPAVRISQLTHAFGSNGYFQSICTDFGAALKAIAGQIANVIGTPCFPAGVDPSKCSLTDSVIDANGLIHDVPLRRCTDASDLGPCWDVPTTGGNCPAGAAVAFRRASGSSVVESTTAECSP
jgi:hypothetical protein